MSDRDTNGVQRFEGQGGGGFTWPFFRGGEFGLDGSLRPAEPAAPVEEVEEVEEGGTRQVQMRTMTSSAQRLLDTARDQLVPANVAEMLDGADGAAQEADAKEISGEHMAAGLCCIGRQSAGRPLPKDSPAGYPTGSLPAGNGKGGRRPRWLERIRARLARSEA